MTFALEKTVRQVIGKFERDVTHTPATKTISNGFGDETLTYGSPVTITVGFSKRGFNWTSIKQGEQDNTDGYVIANADYTIGKNDKITVDGQVFIVKEAVIRYADPLNATKVYTYCILKILTQ